MKEKEKQEISLIGRIFCLEAVILLMGVASFVSWFYTKELTQLFWGVMITSGAVILYFVRQKDWKKHWEEQEKMKQVYDELRRQKQEEQDGKK
jgi:Zn-dependent protease with chaperone function